MFQEAPSFKLFAMNAEFVVFYQRLILYIFWKIIHVITVDLFRQTHGGRIYKSRILETLFSRDVCNFIYLSIIFLVFFVLHLSNIFSDPNKEKGKDIFIQ